MAQQNINFPVESALFATQKVNFLKSKINTDNSDDTIQSICGVKDIVLDTIINNIEKEQKVLDDAKQPNILIYNDVENNKTITLSYKQTLKSGSNGDIYLYSDNNNKYPVICKVTDDLNEYKLLETLVASTFTECSVIPARIIHMDKFNKYWIIMPKMDGNLLDPIIQKIFTNFETKIKFMLILIKMVKCLLNLKYVYTDLKFANILYKCVSNATLTCVFGDIGSIFEIDTPSEIFTYTFIPDHIKPLKADRQYLIWIIYVLFIMLLFDKEIVTELDGHTITKETIKKALDLIKPTTKPEAYIKFFLDNYFDIIYRDNTNDIDVLERDFISLYKIVHSS